MATLEGGKSLPTGDAVAPMPGRSGRGNRTRPRPTRRPKTITVPWVRRKAGRAEPLVMVTAYDYPQARAADEAGVDLILVGDSLAMVVLGHDDTLAVTVDEMLHHVRAVRRGTRKALLVADMPFGSFHRSREQAVDNALRFVKEGGAQAVKIEGARPDVIESIAAAEIPVMAHLGLTPQSLHRFGGFKVQGKSAAARRALLDAALAVEQAGAFAAVLECVPADLAAEVSDRLDIPTIGIGAGVGCDGQVLVLHDLLGFEDRMSPRFVRRYADLGEVTRDALGRYAADVRARRFPSPAESFSSPAEAKVERLYG
ncbi:MAG: 3-methyl-2-oxobutanoate hydroxymethyltransferase [Acidobacteriota bacterium]